MTNFLEKARTGRTIALDTHRNKPESGALAAPKAIQFKSCRVVDPMSFITNRTHVQPTTWLH
ncbi:MAG: hypothetical protein V3U96_06870 [Paracoccaceae bacterium]